MLKIKSYLKNPIAIFSFVTVLLTLALLIGTHFTLPDFYTDRDMAYQLAQINPDAVRASTKGLENFVFKLYNFIFQVWGWSFVLAILSAVFKINTFGEFKNIPILKNKYFIYLWFNLSYIIYAICYIPVYMADLEKFVYYRYADSMGIPFFGILFAFVFLAAAYYPAVNLLIWVTYNTKIKRKFYSFLYILGMLGVSLNAIGLFFMKFSYFILVLNLIHFINIMLFLYSIRYLKEKSLNNSVI